MNFLKLRVDLRIALLYAIFGGVWILLSDHLLATMVSEPSALTRLQTYKGWAFVAASALVIFLLLRRELALRNITEEKLDESEERYRQLFEHSMDAILLTSPDGSIFAANPAACRMFGRTQEEIVRLGRDKVVDVTDPRLKPALEHRARTGGFHGELTLVRGDGSKFPGEVSTTLFKSWDGQDRTSMIIRDITERKRLETSLRTNEEFQRAIISCSPAAIFSIDLEGNVTSWNRSAERIFGWSAGELLGSPLPIVPDEGQDEFAGLRKRIQSGETLSGVELLRRKKDGSLIHVSLSAAPLEGESSMGIMAVMEDISERKRIENDLRYQALLLEQVSDIIVSTDLQGIIRSCNKAAIKLLGVQMDDLIGQPATEVIKAEYVTEDRAEALASLQERGYWKGEVKIQTRDGSILHTIAQASKLTDEAGRPIGYLSINHDITERKRVEEAMRRSEERYRLISSLASDYMFHSRLDDQGRLQLEWVAGAFESITGYTLEEYLLHGGWRASVHPDDLERDNSDMEKLREGRRVITEIRTLTKSGGTRWVRVYAQPVLDTENRQLTGIYGAVQEITERKRAEETLRELENRLKAILNNAPVVLLAVDRDGTFTLSEGAGLKQSGLEPGQVVGQSAYDLYRELPITLPDGRGISGQELLERVFAGETIIASTELNGVHYENRFAPLLDQNGGVNGMVGVSVDVTERKQAEEEVRFSRDRLTELTRRLVETRESEARAIGRELHDQIGQMLTAMKITLDLAGQLPAEAAARKIQQAQGLTGELLDRVSRMSLELRPPMLDDLGLIPALVWHVAQYREGTGIQVDFKHSGVESRRFATEIETTAYRIVQEALTNVARHSAAGRVRLEVRIEAGVSPGGLEGRDGQTDTEWMDIQIEDDGSGFDVDSALAKNRGLGGMRERAQLLGGLFEIESKRGTGTKKRIRLPLREETA